MNCTEDIRKRTQNKTKETRRKELIKIKTKINKLENVNIVKQIQCNNCDLSHWGVQISGLYGTLE